MSIEWMSRVWKEAMDVSGTELLVLLVIADHAQDHNARAWPSVATMCQRTRRAERTVQEALIGLEQKGWIRREFRSGRSTMYYLETPAVGRTPADSAPPQPTAPDPRSGPHPTPAAHRTQNHKGTPNEPGGAVEEVGTEQQQPSTSSEDVKDAAHTPAPEQAAGNAALRTTLPAFARAKLDHLDNTTKWEWMLAWQTIAEQVTEQTLWDPMSHLTRYFARCKQLRKEPAPEEWTRWYADDEMKARRDLVIEREKDRRDAVESVNPFFQ